MKILSLNAFYHDSAAALIINGVVVSAIEEERFTRVKHDNGFPYNAAEFCLSSNKLSINDIDFIAYYEKPLLKFERIIETFLETFPFSLKPFLKAIPDWLRQKIKVEYLIRKNLKYKGKVFFIPHHFSHAAAAFYTSPFKKSAILTIDGVGEYQTTGLWSAKNEIIKPLKQIDFPNSLGLLYSTFTAFLGFKVNEDEYKLMGLSAYGKPEYLDEISNIIDVKDDGSFSLNQQYFGYQGSFTMWSSNFVKLFGPPRLPHEKIEKRHRDIAASLQRFTEQTYLAILNHLYLITGLPNLAISGGVGLNALANGLIYRNTKFKKVHILGSAGDSGAAIGAGLYLYHSILGHTNHQEIKSMTFGSSYLNPEIEIELIKRGLKYKRYDSEIELISTAASHLVKGKILGWFQGKCEFGPRALGNRSILASPYPRSMKEKVNIIKRREQFRPFAGSVLQKFTGDLFDIPEKNHYSPFMNFCFLVKREARTKLAAIVHADNSCRIQTVSPVNGRYYKLIRKYYELTKIPCVLNTSFNLKGEPIVETPGQAIDDFLKTKMDYLIIEDFLVTKN